MRVLSIIHEPTWTESRIHDALRDRGHQVVICCHRSGEPLPEPDDPDVDAVVVNGGDISTWQADDHPFMAAEIAFTRRWLTTAKPYLGVCLGAHILGAAVGVATGPRRDGVAEYGFYPLSPTEAGAALFGELDTVFQCHYEALEALPAGAELLASSERFEIQAFRLDAAIGVQFHPDARADMLEGWWDGNADMRQRPGVQPLEDQVVDGARLEPARAAFVGRLIDEWLPQAAAGETAA